MLRGGKGGFKTVAVQFYEPSRIKESPPAPAAFVQRADGVARIVGNNLSKAEMTAVARAVAVP